jgi:formylglycine-generating enzyme required for sulfatase activity/nitrate/TMAO reductase-like tetraheme cytochrome c subunit
VRRIISFFRRKAVIFFLTGFFIALLIIFSGNKAIQLTSSDEFCASCHNVHPHVNNSWKMSTHFDNKSGVVVHCVDCHLPPEGQGRLREKVKTGLRDVYGVIFKDVENINWEQKSSLQYAIHHSYKSACINCHQNIFPLGLTKEGEDAHLYYSRNEDELHCINCHLSVGHFSDNIHAQNVDFGKLESFDTIYESAAVVSDFENFTEFIPGTSVSFNMKAIPGGTFMMGSPDKEKGRDTDEGPVVEVQISGFFMEETEVSWNEYLAFFTETCSEGRLSEKAIAEMALDGISGPTPPWGDPSQGWGRGEKPAITMSFHAAEVYCEWLSKKTKKKYRLPTEAEWEYAARAGTTGAYFFDGDAGEYNRKGVLKKVFGVDTSTINSYIIYKENSIGKSQSPKKVHANPFGLKNMSGNAAEFCQDYYYADIYSTYSGKITDPQGPESGEEHVIRGGSFNAAPENVRVADRDHTQTNAWLKTDPQMPKSIWWYSDAVHVGFRVVCEYEY